MSHGQKIGQKHSIKIAKRSFEDVIKFKYLGTTLTDKNYMHEAIQSGLNSGNACYHSVQSSVLPLDVLELKVKIYRTIILPIVFMDEKLGL
jgi:sialic acid synthase SpsE